MIETFVGKKVKMILLLKKKDHTYYYQVQLQMKMCDIHFCDFIIWINEELVINRIEHDENFLERKLTKLPHFSSSSVFYLN